MGQLQVSGYKTRGTYILQLSRQLVRRSRKQRKNILLFRQVGYGTLPNSLLWLFNNFPNSVLISTFSFIIILEQPSHGYISLSLFAPFMD